MYWHLNRSLIRSDACFGVGDVQAAPASLALLPVVAVAVVAAALEIPLGCTCLKKQPGPNCHCCKKIHH